MWFEDKDKLAELELKAKLAQSKDCKQFREILLNTVFDYSVGDIDEKELKGMVRLLAITRDWDKKLDKKIKNAKEMVKK